MNPQLLKVAIWWDDADYDSGPELVFLPQAGVEEVCGVHGWGDVLMGELAFVTIFLPARPA